jgi:prepilin-type N-terminal cleavage/methylation domain-containing protein
MRFHTHDHLIPQKRPRGFTLLELLVSIAVISIVMAILLPALGASRGAARGLECKARLRGVVTEFTLFAEPSSGVPRGDSDVFSGDIFRLEDFQERLYGIDEFWDGPSDSSVALNADDSPLLCPSATGKLQRTAGIPCSAGAVGPVAHVSTGFNKRLEEKSEIVNGWTVRRPVYLSSKLLQQPDVPLVFDVDGKLAANQDFTPYYSAPPVLDDKIIDMYESGLFWFPSFRHNGDMNVGFIGGHVLSSNEPGTEPYWRWAYQFK